jgi:hypothetical protein
MLKVEGKKSVFRPGKVWTGPEVSMNVKLQNFTSVGTWKGGKVVSSRHWPPLPPRIYSWYSFLLEAESTPRQ